MVEIIKLIALSFWNVLGLMAPYLIFGYLIAGILSVFVTPNTVKTHLGGSKFSSTLKAALFGMPLPLCSCSVIPVTASLHKSGAGRGAVASFLISTPTTGVDSIMAAWALMGPIFAIYRAIMSVVLGVVSGVFVNFFGDTEINDSENKNSNLPSSKCDCDAKPNSNERGFIKALKYGFITLPKDLGRPLFLGILVAGVISALIESNFIDQFLGGGIGTMFIMLLVGIPLYVCATASIPLALGFMALGASPGAAFVFLIAGPATNAATITVLWKMIGKRSTVILLASIFFGALAGGIALDAVWNGLGANISVGDLHHEDHAGWFYSISAIVIILIQIWASFRSKIIAFFSGETVTIEDSCCSSGKSSSKSENNCCKAEIASACACCGSDSSNCLDTGKSVNFSKGDSSCCSKEK